MRLMTVSEAAKELHVSPGLVRHWVRNGWLARHARPRHPMSQRYRPDVEQKRFYVDVDAASVLTSNGALEKFKADHPDKKLLTASEVAKLLGMHYRTATLIIKRLGVHKYRYHNAAHAFVVDGEELYSSMEDDTYGSIYIKRMARRA